MAPSRTLPKAGRMPIVAAAVARPWRTLHNSWATQTTRPTRWQQVA